MNLHQELLCEISNLFDHFHNKIGVGNYRIIRTLKNDAPHVEWQLIDGNRWYSTQEMFQIIKMKAFL